MNTNSIVYNRKDLHAYTLTALSQAENDLRDRLTLARRTGLGKEYEIDRLESRVSLHINHMLTGITGSTPRLTISSSEGHCTVEMQTDEDQSTTVRFVIVALHQDKHMDILLDTNSFLAMLGRSDYSLLRAVLDGLPGEKKLAFRIRASDPLLTVYRRCMVEGLIPINLRELFL